jgi:hypothetical protein
MRCMCRLLRQRQFAVAAALAAQAASLQAEHGQHEAAVTLLGMTLKALNAGKLGPSAELGGACDIDRHRRRLSQRR